MHTLSARDLREKFASGALKAQEIIDFFLTRIHTHDPKLNAFLAVYDDKARKKAEELDKKRAQGKPLGRLAGVPIAIKDIINIKDEITTCGSKFLTNFKAPFSATIIELLEQEDAILLGKTNMDEFAMGSSTETSAFKKSNNPWNLKCSPGGSSGGSAVAVAARLAPIAFGTDTGGSVRQPASLCGIVGMKPTYGRLSRYGLVALSSSFDCPSPFATNVKDIALIQEITGKYCEKDSNSIPKPADEILNGLSSSLQGVRVGIPYAFINDLEPEYRTSFDRSIELMKERGASVVDVDLSILKYCLATYYVLMTAEASTNLARFDGVRYGVRSEQAKTLDEVYDLSRQEGFGNEVKRRILLGTFVLSSGYQDAYYKKAQKVRRLIMEKYAEAFKICDVIATPTSPFAAFEIGSIKDPLQMYLADIYTIGNNLAGLPGISVPADFTHTGLPIGLQLTGPQLSEPKLLSIAYAFEEASQVSNHIPPGF